jgi:hypothetical protein
MKTIVKSPKQLLREHFAARRGEVAEPVRDRRLGDWSEFHCGSGLRQGRRAPPWPHPRHSEQFPRHRGVGRDGLDQRSAAVRPAGRAAVR